MRTNHSSALDGSATTIADYAFNADSRGDAFQLIIPATITALESRAFDWSYEIKLTIYYLGTQAQWENVIGNDTLSSSAGSATICFYSAEDPFAAGDTEGNFWLYAPDGTPVLWERREETFLALS